MTASGPTFNLLPDDTAVARSLRRILAHLTPSGKALIPLFVPQPTPTDWVGRAREHVTDDGRRLLFTTLSETRDEHTRIYEAIAAADADLARASALLHIATNERWLREHLDPAEDVPLGDD